jgi:hypothetical protein
MIFPPGGMLLAAASVTGRTGAVGDCRNKTGKLPAPRQAVVVTGMSRR